MVSLTKKLREWSLHPQRPFDVLYWDEDFIEHQYFNQVFGTLSDINDLPKTFYVRFPDMQQEGAWINNYSVGLVPISDWDEMGHLIDAYEKFVYKNGYDGSAGLFRPEFRVLCHMKFRGMVGNRSALFSDRNNLSKNIDYIIPAEMQKNRCVVFEYEFSDRAVRNYFYCSDDNTFVNTGKPSWVKNLG
jgi:hypothetical protein